MKWISSWTAYSKHCNWSKKTKTKKPKHFVVSTGASSEKCEHCSGRRKSTDMRGLGWLSVIDFKEITGSSEELLAICVYVCVCVCVCLSVCVSVCVRVSLQSVDEKRASKQASILWASPGQDQWAQGGSEVGVLEQAPHRLPQQIHTHTCTHTHSIPLLGTKGHHVIDVVSELRGRRAGRDTQTQTHTQQSFSSALTGSALNATIYN